MNVFLIIYIFGVIFTYLFMFWLVEDNDWDSQKMYLMLAVSWIVTVPLFVVLCLVSLVMVKCDSNK